MTFGTINAVCDLVRWGADAFTLWNTVNKEPAQNKVLMTFEVASDVTALVINAGCMVINYHGKTTLESNSLLANGKKFELFANGVGGVAKCIKAGKTDNESLTLAVLTAATTCARTASEIRDNLPSTAIEPQKCYGFFGRQIQCPESPKIPDIDISHTPILKGLEIGLKVKHFQESQPNIAMNQVHIVVKNTPTEVPEITLNNSPGTEASSDTLTPVEAIAITESAEEAQKELRKTIEENRAKDLDIDAKNNKIIKLQQQYDKLITFSENTIKENKELLAKIATLKQSEPPIQKNHSMPISDDAPMKRGGPRGGPINGTRKPSPVQRNIPVIPVIRRDLPLVGNAFMNELKEKQKLRAQRANEQV